MDLDKLYLAVGRSHHSWDQVEKANTEIFRVVSGLPIRHLSRAYLIMQAIVSFQARLQVTHSLVGDAGLSPHLLKLWNGLQSRALKLHKKRNELAHFSILGRRRDGHEPEPMVAPYYVFGDAKTMLSLEQVEDRNTRFIKMAIALGYLRELMSQHLEPTSGFLPLTADQDRWLQIQAGLIHEDSERPPRSSHQ